MIMMMMTTMAGGTVKLNENVTSSSEKWDEINSSMYPELYYPSSENKDADQLRGYRDREADLRLCFRLCRLLVFS